MLVSWLHHRRCRRVVACSATAVLLIASSCASSRQYAGSADRSADFPAANAHYSVDAQLTAQDPSGATSASPAAPRVVQLNHGETAAVASEDAASASWSADAFENPADVSDESRAPIALTSHWYDQAAPTEQAAEVATPIEQTSGPACDPAASSDCPGSFLPADPRVELPLGAHAPGHCRIPGGATGGVALPVHEPELYPEEYICDGGDRGVRVYYDEFGRRGLDTEDTIAEFTTHEGLRRIKPSTRVCIYAPQFAAVRSMSQPQLNLAVDTLAGTHDHRPTSGLRSHLTPGVELQADQPIGLDLRLRASGLDRDLLNGAVARVQAPARHIKLNNLFENRLILSGIELDRTEEAYLAQAIQLAATWTREQNPVIVAADAGGEEVVATFHVEEYVGIEERPPGDLKIIKVVDEPAAVPGDVVTFTIRYENIGERELYNIRIVDNLTPRLQLLPETTQSDREGNFSVEDNEEGSVVLTFELAAPLPPKTGGTLTFQCRVR